MANTILRCGTCGTTATFRPQFSYNNEVDGRAAFEALAARGGHPSFAGLASEATLRCCGRTPRRVEVRGTFRPAHKCDARCLAGTGNRCECACGGKNHGMGYAA